MNRSLLGLFLLVAVVVAKMPEPLAASNSASDYVEAIQALDRFIAREVKDKNLPSLAVVLVDDQKIVWAKGFGYANAWEGVEASPNTIYRVGSVSKLFTNIAAMQLVEEGVVDLNAPITKYLPSFQPRNPFGKEITLRQLMAHRSGLVREPPNGHYFDKNSRSLSETVRSLNSSELLYEPGSRVKYSNAGVAVVGYLIECIKKEPFAKYLRHTVLEPIGLKQSAFDEALHPAENAAEGLMWTYHGRTFPAPFFQPGIIPATGMVTTVNDLGRFLSWLFARNGRAVKPATLDQMFTVQFADDQARRGFGLGFYCSELEGHRCIGHDGAIFGFATDLAALPDEKLGVAVVVAKDGANAIAEHIATVALQDMLAVRKREAVPKIADTTPLDSDTVRKLAGRYENAEVGIDLVASGSKLFAWPVRGGVRKELRACGEALVTDDLLDCGHTLRCRGEQLMLDSQTLTRVSIDKPRPIPDRWKGLVGEYGWDHDVLYILEKDGKLQALIEWFFLYPLEELPSGAFKCPNWGLYQDEKVVFARDTNGRATQLQIGSVVFPRRHIDGESGATFKIRPLRSIEELRKLASSAKPPREAVSFREPDLIEVARLDSTIKLDIRYASSNNFLDVPLYSHAKAFLQRPAAEALVRAHKKLAERGYGLLIHDGYRPWCVTKMFWDATPEEHHIFVADPLQGSRHNRGCAVDLTLYELRTGKAVEMVGGYDEFSDRSYPDYPGGTSLQRWHRELLRRAMEDEGFTVYEAEWWHFDFRDWKKYPILNLTFEQIESNAEKSGKE